jgi:hypothetical protein
MSSQDEQQMIHPTIQDGSGFGYPISGRIILEGAAFVQELELMRHWRGSVAAEYCRNRVDEGQAGMYGATIHYKNHALDDPNWDPRLLSRILDLSMMGIVYSIHAPYERIRPGWTNFHPGWRFCRSLGRSRDIGTPNPDASDSEYDSFVAELCQLEDWPSPKRIAERTGRLFKRGDTESEDGIRVCKFFNMNAFSEYFHRHYWAMRTRYEVPSIFVDTAANFGLLFGRSSDDVNLLRPSIVVGSKFYAMDVAMLCMFFANYLSRVIAKGNRTELTTAEQQVQHYLQPQMSNVFDGVIDFLWTLHLGTPPEQFVDSASWK